MNVAPNKPRDPVTTTVDITIFPTLPPP